MAQKFNMVQSTVCDAISHCLGMLWVYQELWVLVSHIMFQNARWTARHYERYLIESKWKTLHWMRPTFISSITVTLGQEYDVQSFIANVDNFPQGIMVLTGLSNKENLQILKVKINQYTKIKMSTGTFRNLRSPNLSKRYLSPVQGPEKNQVRHMWTMPPDLPSQSILFHQT